MRNIHRFALTRHGNVHMKRTLPEDFFREAVALVPQNKRHFFGQTDFKQIDRLFACFNRDELVFRIHSFEELFRRNENQLNIIETQTGSLFNSGNSQMKFVAQNKNLLSTYIVGYPDEVANIFGCYQLPGCNNRPEFRFRILFFGKKNYRICFRRSHNIFFFEAQMTGFFRVKTMMYSKIFVGILLLTVFFSCGKSYKKRAAEKFDQAIVFCEKKDTSAALQCLDSILFTFPEAFETIDKTKSFIQKINSEILFRKQDQFDKVSNRVNELVKLFDTEKTEYDRFMQYIPKTQNFERRWDQSFIKLHLDERGELYISSNYSGTDWLNHIGIRVYDGVFQAKTDTVDLGDPNNHHSEFMGKHWEKVSYKNGKDNGVIQFIADNVDRNLKAVFLGKRMYYIVLEQFDKQAVRDALALSEALKQKAHLEKEISDLQSKVK